MAQYIEGTFGAVGDSDPVTLGAPAILTLNFQGTGTVHVEYFAADAWRVAKTFTEDDAEEDGTVARRINAVGNHQWRLRCSAWGAAIAYRIGG